MNSSKLKARLIILSLLAAFIAFMSISMTASATSSSVEPARSASTALDLRSEAIDSDSMACWPDGRACSTFNDQCCGVCQVLVGHAGRCAFDTPPVAP